MKRTSILVLVLFSLPALSQPVVLDAILAFILAGIIPGTTLALPAGFMLICFAALFFVTARWAKRKLQVSR